MNRFLHFLSATGVILFSYFITNGQPNTLSSSTININNNIPVTKNRQHIESILQQQQALATGPTKSGGKVTSTEERIIASSNYDFFPPDTSLYQLGKTDSSHFTYNDGGRTSKFNYNTMAYDAPANYYNKSYPVISLFSGLHITYAGPAYHPAVMCDTALIWSATAPDPSGHHLYTYAFADLLAENYDSSNNIIAHYDNPNPALSKNINGFLNSYDPYNRNTVSITLLWNSSHSSFDTSSSTVHLYNISSKLAIDSTNNYAGGGTWVPSEKWYYNYDVSGNLIHAMYYYDSAGVWVEQEQYFMSYNANNTLNSDSDIIYQGGVWLINNYNTYGYQEGINYYTSYNSTNFINGIFNDKTTRTKHVSTSGAAEGLPDTLFSSLYNITTGIPPSYLASSVKSVFTYDAFQNPLAAYEYNFNITNHSSGGGYYASALGGVTYYYYQNYALDAVKNISSIDKNITFYPNPTTNNVSISYPGAVNGSYTTLRLVNNLGQTIQTETLPWINQTETFSLTGIAPGMYVLMVQDDKGSILASSKIIKQ